jgi:hypothetical protein
MPVASAGGDYNNLLTTTMEMIEPTLYDQIFDDLPFWKWLNSKGSVKKSGGGESIHYEVEYAQKTGEKSYEDYDLLDTTPHEFMMRAFYNWKSYAVPVVISGDDKDKNAADKTKILDLLEEKTNNAMSSLRDDLSVDSFGDGTGNGSKDIVGLQALVADTPTSGIVGNLNAATYTWWRNQYTNTAGSFAGGGLAFMRDMYNDCTFGAKKPDAIFTTQVVHEYYEASLQPQQRFSGTSISGADGGFGEILFKKAPVIFDRDCGSGRMYFLNSKFIQLRILNGKDFKSTPFVTPTDQDVSIAQILFKGALTVPARRYHGVVTGITA